MEIHTTDKKLLHQLLANSRRSLSQLAKKTRISREVATYRLKRLRERAILLKSFARIDIARLGYVGAAVFLTITAEKEGEFKRRVDKHPNISWVARYTGTWSFGMSIHARTMEEVDATLSKLLREFGKDILDYRFTPHKANEFFWEKGVGGSREQERKREGEIKIDEQDHLILQELTKDARVDYATLSQKVGLGAQRIKERIKRMERSGIIQQYTAFLDLTKLGLHQYSCFVSNEGLHDEERRRHLLNHLREHAHVIFIAQYQGDPFLEFGLVVESPYELNSILQEFRTRFPANRVLELNLVQEDVVSIGPPRCVFE